MSFLTILALGVAALVAAPYLAHRLRRKRAAEVPFAPARLVPEAPPKARRRARLEDRSLFAIRAAAIVALALLGASPLVRCSRLALSRGGASVAVAIVIDDSMSMRAKDASGATRFERVKKGAEEILASLREGDAAAIVLAGAPARVGLAATTDVGAARAALEGVGESDRATDLDGALAIARTLVGALPQIDRRVIVLSDLADGKSDAPALGSNGDFSVPIWVAMPELARANDAVDCGILAADRASGRARVRFACSAPHAAAGRDVQIKDGETILASAPLPPTALGEVLIPFAGDDARELFAVLTGDDAIAADDRALVVVESGPAALAVVGDRTDDAVSTGGAPVVEQALAALHVDMAVRPIPQAPDRREDTAPFAAMILDDPPGFTPEQRHALTAFVDRGGVLVLALGSRAAAAPLGATFEPFLAHAPSFGPTPTQSVDPESAALVLGDGATSLADLAAKGRATVAPDDVASFDSLLKWSDGAPLVLRRARGRGEVWLTTLSFSVDASDIPLRPGFLSLLDAIVSAAKERSAPLRGEVGVPWVFAGARQVQAEGPRGQIPPARGDGALRIAPALLGPYRLTVDGAPELRVAAPVQREIDLRPRAVISEATSSSLGGDVSVVDVSWLLALALLALVAAETVVRAMTRPRGGTA